MKGYVGFGWGGSELLVRSSTHSCNVSQLIIFVVQSVASQHACVVSSSS